MAFGFVKKEWKQRIVEFPGRRRLDDTSTADVYDVSRAEGNIIQAGDGFTADNMNDLEKRVDDALFSVDTEINQLNEKIPDVANNLTTTNPGYYLDARQGKILADKIVRIQVSGTTDGYGLVVLNINTNFTQTPFALTNIGDSSATPYIIMVQAYTNTRVVIRVRSFYDATAVANTSVNFAALLIGV